MNELFNGISQEALFEVLKAYSLHRPDEGYCQAQAPIAALLLMHMPAEQAFWCLVVICDKYLTGYYSPGLRKQHIEPIMYMTEWFMCVYTRTLSWTIVLRLWDQFLCEGVKVMFRVGLVLLRVTLEDHLDQCPSFYETLEKLRMKKMPLELQDESFLFTESLRLSVAERDMQREHQKQVSRRKAAREAAEREKAERAAGGQAPSAKQSKSKKKS
ncbi:TBC1 domain family member 10A-like [Elysia marginata]|uniref:TBC1 domain family member 10A-like n=1 Tax=Elysia marginata TaxID=1093978 RepID=A0AAV4H3R1_9GAST|nr:TBC1 domain family member 10A-like [Elysia marginata]